MNITFFLVHVLLEILPNEEGMWFIFAYPKIHLEKKLTLLRINLKKLYFQIIITKLICSLGYNKYVAKSSDLVTPALDYSPAPLGDGTHQPTKKVLVSMDFPPHFDNLALQLMFSHFFFGHPLIHYNTLDRPDIQEFGTLLCMV